MKASIATVHVALAAVFAVPGDVFARRLPYTESFMIERCEFRSRGRNPYFILEPGYRLTLEGEEKGERLQLTITVLDETEQVGDVETRVVEERETVDGELVEVSRNFHAVCAPTDSVFYFGEDVANYENGVVVSNEGAWRAGVAGARPGIIMPGQNLVGARYFQELAPGIALDRAETISVTETLSTPAGQFVNVLKVKETTPLERRAREFKFYAPGVGLIQDGPLRLVAVTAP